MSKTAVVTLLILAAAGEFRGAASQQSNANSKFYWIWNRHSDFKGLIKDKGPNMCASMDVVDDKGLSLKSFYSECMSYAPNEVCGLDTKPRFHCCNGYEKESTNARGCNIVKAVKNMGDTLDDEGLRNFHDAWMKVDPKGELLIPKDDDRVTTIFVPEQFDLDKLPPNVKQQFNSPGENNLFYQQVVQSRLKSSDMPNEALLSSKYSGGAPIRINRYNGGIMTANCVRVLRPNFMATDGIIHVTEGLIPVMKDTDWNIVLDNPQLSKFKEYLIKTKLDSKLQQPGCITIFPPTNDAFDKLDVGVKNLIEENNEALKKLLLHHMTDCCLCSASIMTSSNPRTMDGGRVHIHCADGGKSFQIDEAMATEVDHVSRNGVAHVIDKVLISDGAKTLKVKMEEQGLTNFLELVKVADYMSLLSGREAITVFAPSNHAIGMLMDNLKSDKELAKVWVANHIAKGIHSTSQLMGVEHINNVNENTNFSNHLFTNVYHRQFGVNNALLVKADFHLANGVLHVLNSTIEPVSVTLAERMSEMLEISLFWNLVERSGREAFNNTEDGQQWTIFAPKNSVIASLGTGRWDEERIQEFLEKHTIKRAIFPAGLEIEDTHQYVTEDGTKIDIKPDNKLFRINKTIKVEKMDYLLNNGVLYVINRSL